MGTIETPRLQRIAQQQLSKHPTDLSKQLCYVFFPHRLNSSAVSSVFSIAALSGSIFEHTQGYLGHPHCTTHLLFPKAFACVFGIRLHQYYAKGRADVTKERFDAMEEHVEVVAVVERKTSNQAKYPQAKLSLCSMNRFMLYIMLYWVLTLFFRTHEKI